MAFWLQEAVAGPIQGRRRQAYPLTALGPFLDILIPRDETGSATDFGVHRTLIDHARGTPGYMRLLRAGCKWLDFEARRMGATNYAALDAVSQEAVLVKATKASGGTLPRKFFEINRDFAFRAYYADPASWQSAGYRGPPQPDGFMDHSEAPGDR